MHTPDFPLIYKFEHSNYIQQPQCFNSLCGSSECKKPDASRLTGLGSCTIQRGWSWTFLNSITPSRRLAVATPDILNSCAALDDDDISVICALIRQYHFNFWGTKRAITTSKTQGVRPIQVISLCPRILLFANLPSRSCLSPSVKTVSAAFMMYLAFSS